MVIEAKLNWLMTKWDFVNRTINFTLHKIREFLYMLSICPLLKEDNLL